MQKDQLHHFLFENTPIRGNLVHLNHTYTQALQHQQLPQVIKLALGELMAASTLLTSTLKMDGTLTLQIQSKGVLKLLVVECSSNLEMRATAKWEGLIAEETHFLSLIEDGHCAITLDTTNNEPYQGIVPIQGNSIAEMLEHYMQQSQQIDTRLWLSCDGLQASGMLLQKLPEQPEHDLDAWNRVGILANTMSDNELQSYDVERLITHLFNEEDVRLFEAKQTRFHCKCTRDRVANMLKMLGEDEVESILSEQKSIEVNCDFCNKHYSFDKVDAATLFTNTTVVKSNKTTH